MFDRNFQYSVKRRRWQSGRTVLVALASPMIGKLRMELQMIRTTTVMRCKCKKSFLPR